MEEMRRISCLGTIWIKCLVPLFLFSWTGLVFAIAAIAAIGSGIKEAILILCVPCLIGGLFYWLTRRFLFDLADSVWLAGNELLIRKGKQEIRLPLHTIAHVSGTYSSPSRIVLTLRGKEPPDHQIAFLAKMHFGSDSPIVSELIHQSRESRPRP